MQEPFSENTVWVSADWRRTPLRQLDDRHLVNVAWFVRQRLASFSRGGDGATTFLENLGFPPRVGTEVVERFLAVVRGIAAERGFNPEKVGTIQIPYERRGQWCIWDEERRQFDSVPAPARDLLEELRA